MMTIDFVYIAIVILVVFGSMVLHELMHGLTAYWLGDDTAKIHGRLTLNPMKHIDPVMTILLPVILAITSSFVPGTPIFGGAKPVPFRPDRVKGGEWGAALVGVVGPLTNLVLAFIFFVIGQVTGQFVIDNNEMYYSSGLLAMFLMVGVMVNIGFFVFNMLPIPPLDGSRLLYAIAPPSVQKAMEALENFGIILVFGLLLVAGTLIGNIMSSTIEFILQFFMMLVHL